MFDLTYIVGDDTFLSVPFEDYSVTDGLLLLILLALFIAGLWKLFRGCMNW